ncbi:MAG: hypothetical protein E4H01_07365 [Lysobacterales bacterium]|nr:MAG: hypothetical protein E4H01_07365 [Xanthomonadales bacterium]
MATDAIVRVSYQTVQGKSKRAVNGASIPVTLNLRNSATGSLSVTGLYTQNDSKNPDAGRSIIGIGGDRQWGMGKLDSQFLISQVNDSNGAKGGVWDRAAMKLGGDTSVGLFKFSGSYLHAGESFAGAKEYGTGVGKDAMSFATSVAPSKSLAAGASYQSAQDTTGAAKGNRTVTNAQNVAFTPIDSTKLSFSRTTSELTTAKGNRSTASTSGFQFSSTAVKKVALRSSMIMKTSDAVGDERGFSAGMTTTAIDRVNLEMGYATLENKAVGQQTSTDVKVTATPMPLVNVQAAYSGVDSTVKGASTKTNVAIQTTAIANMQIQASAADSVTDTTRTFQRGLSLTSTPTRFAKFVAMFSQKGVNSRDDVTKSAQLELTPLKNTHLAAGYKYAETGPSVLTIHDYSAQTKQWDFLSFAGSYRQRDLNTANAPDSTAVSVSLAPAKLFAITGEYVSNPEDKLGAVQNFNTTSVGMKTKVGSVGVETNYLEKNDYRTAQLSNEAGVNLALPVFGHGKLTTGCKFGRMLGTVDQESMTYLLGYSHSIGSDFSLSFTGYYTQYLQTKVALPDKDDVSAQASLVVKF